MNTRMISLIALTLAIALPGAASACATYETVSYESVPESRTWVSGHYEWVGDDYAYVPGHWLVIAASCEETRVVHEQPCETVVYTRPACSPTVVYERRSPAVVYTRPSCEREVVYTRPSRRDDGPHVHVSLPLPPVAVLPLPIPVPFFGHHRH